MVHCIDKNLATRTDNEVVIVNLMLLLQYCGE